MREGFGLCGRGPGVDPDTARTMCPQRTTGWTWRKWRSCGNDTGPKLIIAGWSAYPRHLDFAEFRRIADTTAQPFEWTATAEEILAKTLEEQRLEAVSARIDADLTNNRHGELVGELRRLVASHRLHEPFHIRLMQALHRSGRRGEALSVYHQLRAILDQDLGLEPSGEARQMQCEILNSD